jgi:hypothetical protein
MRAWPIFASLLFATPAFAQGQSIEPPPAAPETNPYEGVYVRLELYGAFPTAHHNNVDSGDVYGSSATVTGDGLYGAGVGTRVGYSWGDYGVGGFFLTEYDHAGETAKGSGRTDTWNFYRAGGAIGPEFRYMPHFDRAKTVRPTAGVGVALAGRTTGYQRVVENTSHKDKADFIFYMTPTFTFDVGVMIGTTPGTRFFAGLLMMLDTPSAQTLPSAISKKTDPIPANAVVKTATGAEFFIGPTLGLSFGH